MKLPISCITINERQRVDLGDLTDLDTMSDPRIGQILPIVCDRHGNLLDGRRRLAKATALGWTEIEVHTRISDDDDYTKQLIELYADIGRKDRTWQERCLAYLKLYSMNPGLTYRQLATIMGCSLGNVKEVLNIAQELRISIAQQTDDDKELWATSSVFEAAKVLIIRQARVLEKEMNRRAGLLNKPSVLTPENIAKVSSTGGTIPIGLLSKVLDVVEKEQPKETRIESINLNDFCTCPLGIRLYHYNSKHPDDWPLVMNDEGDFLYGCWFLGGGNISEFYGSYSSVFFKRINDLFESAKKRLHLFAGSLPKSDKYIRVGLDPTGLYTYEIQCDAESLDSNIEVRAYNPDIIFADPPYSVEDMEHYQNKHLVNRAKVLSACSRVLQPGGIIVWLDQVLPVFSNDELKWIGCISYIRSTANRFRCVIIFQKPLE